MLRKCESIKGECSVCCVPERVTMGTESGPEEQLSTKNIRHESADVLRRRARKPADAVERTKTLPRRNIIAARGSHEQWSALTEISCGPMSPAHHIVANSQPKNRLSARLEAATIPKLNKEFSTFQ